MATKTNLTPAQRKRLIDRISKKVVREILQRQEQSAAAVQDYIIVAGGRIVHQCKTLRQGVDQVDRHPDGVLFGILYRRKNSMAARIAKRRAAASAPLKRSMKGARSTVNELPPEVVERHRVARRNKIKSKTK